MTDLKQLIHLNVELEGLLKVLADRDSLEARSMLSEKFKTYSAMLQEYLAEPNPSPAQTAAVEQEASSLVAEATHVEVKDQEAVEEESMSEGDIATRAIDKEENKEQNTKLLKAFTLNDRFRFCRELFGGNNEDFTDTLNLLADMDSYREAEEYLLNDMMWYRSTPGVEDFLAILKQNMPA